jgi:hypothetical protein
VLNSVLDEDILTTVVASQLQRLYAQMAGEDTTIAEIAVSDPLKLPALQYSAH